mmetsp:Transcript_15326/g.42009  ORF Transcript_15326/g.42009 Transcript_15326/m.42009 type:complete len:498 (+) Transcript_15326:189-1682(+)
MVHCQRGWACRASQRGSAFPSQVRDASTDAATRTEPSSERPATAAAQASNADSQAVGPSCASVKSASSRAARSRSSATGQVASPAMGPASTPGSAPEASGSPRPASVEAARAAARARAPGSTVSQSAASKKRTARSQRPAPAKLCTAEAHMRAVGGTRSGRSSRKVCAAASQGCPPTTEACSAQVLLSSTRPSLHGKTRLCPKLGSNSPLHPVAPWLATTVVRRDLLKEAPAMRLHSTAPCWASCWFNSSSPERASCQRRASHTALSVAATEALSDSTLRLRMSRSKAEQQSCRCFLRHAPTTALYVIASGSMLCASISSSTPRALSHLHPWLQAPAAAPYVMMLALKPLCATPTNTWKASLHCLLFAQSVMAALNEQISGSTSKRGSRRKKCKACLHCPEVVHACIAAFTVVMLTEDHAVPESRRCWRSTDEEACATGNPRAARQRPRRPKALTTSVTSLGSVKNLERRSSSVACRTPCHAPPLPCKRPSSLIFRQ